VATYPTCADALAALRDMSDTACHDYRGLREIVMCRAWEDFRQGRTPTFSAAVEDGWAQVRGACAAHGGITPEVGFLAPPPAPTPTVREVYHAGTPVGVVVASGDEQWLCQDTTCTPVTPDSLAALLSRLGAEVR
jgi:hypothetical protein